MTSKFYMPVRSILVIFLAYAGGVSSASAQDLTAEEILAKSKEAMQQPLSYRIVDEKFETTVYQKTLADGTKAVFKEAVSKKDSLLPFKITSLQKGNRSYEIYLEEGIVLDTSFRIRKTDELKKAAENNSQKKEQGVEPSEQKDDLSSRYTVEIAPHNGKNCYLVSWKAKDIIFRYIIEQGTFLELEVDVVKETGERLFGVNEKKDLTLCPDLTDDFFQIPPGMETKIMANEVERAAVFQEILAKKFPPPQKVEMVEPIPLPPPTPTPLPQIEGVGELPAPRSSSRILFVIGVNVVFLAIIGTLIHRNLTKSSQLRNDTK